MTTLLRWVLIASGTMLAVGLVLHLLGWAMGDRVIAFGLIALVSIPVVNSSVALVEEFRRQ